jgi:two-component system sensor histidine kinase UhpB
MTKAEEENTTLEKRVATLEAAASAATRFLRNPAWDESLPAVLESIGAATGASRVEVAQWLSPDPADHRLRHRWWWAVDGSSGHEPISETDPDTATQPIQPTWWKSMLQQGERIVGAAGGFDNAEKDYLVGQGIRAIAMIPVTAHGDLWGQISVIDTESDRGWTADDIDPLAAIAETLGAAIEHKRSDRLWRFLEQAVETLSVGVTVRDIDGNIIYTNPAEAAMHGYTIEEISGMPARQLAPEDAWRTDRRPDASWLLGWRRERLNRRKDGSIFPVQLTSVALRDETDTPIAVATISEDISERKRIEEALRRSEEHHRGLFQAAKDAIIVIDPDEHTVLDANPRACQVYGYGRSQLVGMSLDKIATEFRREKDHIEETLEDQQLHHFETTHLRSDGSEIVFDVTASVLEREGRDAILSINRDVSDRKRAEAALEQSREQLRKLADHLQKAREDERMAVARTIHDELGQMLTALAMDVAWVARRVSPDAVEVHDKSTSMLELIDSAVVTVRQLSTELRPPLLDDLGLAAAVEWYTGDFASRTGIECRLKMNKPEFTLDRTRATALFRILQEALTNVSRHAATQLVEVDIGLEDEVIVLSVRDRGQGIDDEQIESSQSLGLLGMRERAAALGGELTVSRLADGGTEIVARVPVQRGEDEAHDQSADL